MGERTEQAGMRSVGSYGAWSLEEANLDAALTNAAQQALHGVNREGAAALVRVGRTRPQQYLVIGKAAQITRMLKSEGDPGL